MFSLRSNAVDFAIDGRQYFALKMGDLVTIFDAPKRVLVSSSSIVSEIGPFLANLLNFRLVLSDRSEVARVPPPSFAFAPFYVDQDRSWQRPWSSFRDLGMFARAQQFLAEYHSCLRTNDYYQAKAERDAARVAYGATSRDATCTECRGPQRAFCCRACRAPKVTAAKIESILQIAHCERN